MATTYCHNHRNLRDFFTEYLRLTIEYDYAYLIKVGSSFVPEVVFPKVWKIKKRKETGKNKAKHSTCHKTKNTDLFHLVVFFHQHSYYTHVLHVLLHWHGDNRKIIARLPLPLKYTWDPFYRHDVILMLAWIANYIHYKVWVKLRIHSQTSTVAPLKFGNG